MDCSGCGEPIMPDDTTVYADGGEQYHLGCEFESVYTDTQVGPSEADDA